MSGHPAKSSRSPRPLSDEEVRSIESRAAIQALRAANEQLQFASLSAAVASSVDDHGELFQEVDALIEAASEIVRTLERRLTRHADAQAQARGKRRARSASGPSEEPPVVRAITADSSRRYVVH